MQKLTEEQREYIYEQIFDDPDVAQYSNEIESNIDVILKRLTEQEPPEISIDIGAGWEISIEFWPQNIPTEQEVYFCVLKNGIARQNTPAMTSLQFQQFVDGCQKVLEYLNE